MIEVHHSGNVDVHHVYSSGQLARIEAKLDALIQKGSAMSVQLDALTAAVQRNTDAEQAAADLIRGLAVEVSSLEPTQAAIDNLSATLNAQADAMAAAVVAGTQPAVVPPTPTPPEPPAPPPEPAPVVGP